MRMTITLITMSLTLAASAGALADDGLFSKVSIDAVHGPSSSTGSTGRIESPTRVAGPATLSDLLTRAGLSPTEVSTQVISVKVERGGWSLPVLLTFNDDRSQIRMVMMLNTLQDGQEMTSEKLMGLLDANRESAAATFAYSTKRRRVELHRLIDNRSITADKLQDELNGLAVLAEKTQALWTIDEKTTKTQIADAQPQTTESSASASAPASTPASTTAAALVGKWSAARSKTQAFALQISANGTFALVTVTNGKTSKSTGKYTLSGQTLTLVDSGGTRLAGSVSATSANEFKFTPESSSNAASLTFKRAT